MLVWGVAMQKRKKEPHREDFKKRKIKQRIPRIVTI